MKCRFCDWESKNNDYSELVRHASRCHGKEFHQIRQWASTKERLEKEQRYFQLHQEKKDLKR